MSHAHASGDICNVECACARGCVPIIICNVQCVYPKGFEPTIIGMHVYVCVCVCVHLINGKILCIHKNGSNSSTIEFKMTNDTVKTRIFASTINPHIVK